MFFDVEVKRKSNLMTLKSDEILINATINNNSAVGNIESMHMQKKKDNNLNRVIVLHSFAYAKMDANSLKKLITGQTKVIAIMLSFIIFLKNTVESQVIRSTIADNLINEC